MLSIWPRVPDPLGTVRGLLPCPLVHHPVSGLVRVTTLESIFCSYMRRLRLRFLTRSSDLKWRRPITEPASFGNSDYVSWRGLRTWSEGDISLEPTFFPWSRLVDPDRVRFGVQVTPALDTGETVPSSVKPGLADSDSERGHLVEPVLLEATHVQVHWNPTFDTLKTVLGRKFQVLPSRRSAGTFLALFFLSLALERVPSHQTISFASSDSGNLVVALLFSLRFQNSYWFRY